MRFGKLSLKAAALALVGVVSSAFAQAPMDISADDWNYLNNFKLWGTKGIETSNRPEFYDSRFYDRNHEDDFSGYTDVWSDTLGWVGTAKGDLTTDEAGWFDGPIIVGGTVSVPDHGNNEKRRAYLLTGPIRTTGGITNARSRGTVCQGTNKTGACANVHEIRPNLTVPGLTGVTLSGTLNVSGRKILKVSDYCSENQVCDIFFNSISFGNDSRLVVQMPEKGQPTRIFTNSISFGTHPEIVVAYQGKGDLKLTEYDGNLLIYSNGDINFDNTDNVPVMGTIVSKGTITLGRNMIFAGQFIANKIVVGNEIKAETFVFKKFNPKIEISVGNNSKKVKESDKWESIDIVLSEESETDVTFSYCFDFYSASGVDGVYAGHQDLGAKDASHAFPICGDSEVKVTIPAGKTKAEGIVFKPLLDGLVEKDEILWFQINDLKGASTNSEYEDKGYKIYIVSNDELPTVTSALVVNVNEDTKYTFTKDEFKFKHSSRTFASVIITSLPGKGSFLYDGKAVTKNQTIDVANLGKLTYQAAANEFGDKYATFKYKVIGSGTGDNTSIEYEATINVIPVNDKPAATSSKFTFTVAENPSKDALVGTVTYTDVKNELSVDSYTFALNSSDANYTEFSKYFVLNSSTGEVKVKGTQTFDYYTKSSYTVTATVSDNAATEKTKIAGPLTSEKFTIVVNVKNQNHAPTIANQTFSIPEKNKTTSGIVDWTSAKVVGNVTAKDVDGDNLTYSVVDTGIPFDFKPGTNSLIVSKGSVLDYETKSQWKFSVKVTDPSGASATATITVNLEDVNEEPEPSDVKSEYKVNENTATGTSFGTFTVTDNDAGDKLTYTLSGALTGAAGITGSLKNKTLADIFYVDESANSSGKRTVSIKVKNSALLDYEQLYKASSKNASYPVTITITDKGPNSVDVNTKITVVDLNEGLTATGGTFYIQEHSVGGSHVCTKSYDEDCSDTDYGHVSGVDEDKYNKSFSTLHYSISTANTGVKLTDSKSFVVDEDDGSIYTASNAEFEADGAAAKTSYSFYVTVSDGTNSKDVLVTVLVVDIEEPPINLVTEGSGKIREDAGEGTLAATFSKEYITDPAELAKFEALGNDVYYKINEDASGYGVFKANTVTGEIKLDTDDPTKIDFETLCAKDASCKINGTSPVYVVNMSAFNADQSVTLNITRNIEIVDVNEAPTAKDLTTTVDENIPGGTKVGTIEASDPDKYASCKPNSHSCGFNTLHYSIVDVAGLPFEIDQNTGDIKLKTNERLRYIDKQKYVFEVKVSDRATSEQALSTTAKVTINVKDVNEPSEFKVLADLYDVDENTAVDETFGDQIIVYDEDAADVCTSTSCKLTLTVKDNDACTKGSCAEDLFKVVRDGNTNSKHETPFKFAVKSDLNYEALYKKNLGGAIFNVTVTVKDADGNETSQETQIRVNDVNEEPSFKEKKYEFTVRELIKVDSVLGTAEASDPDIWNKDFGTLYFSLDGDADQIKNFYIDEETGDIHIINNPDIDYENKDKNTFSFYAVVTDKVIETPVKVPVTITVLDEPEGPKFPEDTPKKLYVDENTLKGTKLTEDAEGKTVAKIVAVDDDCKNKSACADAPAYTLKILGDAKSFFTIDANGVISVIADSVLNYEEIKKFEARVVATDAVDENLKDSVDITIYIGDVNDAPVYDKPEYVFDIDENKAAGEVVGAVFASDEDTWSELTFTLTDYVKGSKESELFSINGSGRITTKSKLNYEDKAVYELFATVTDNGEDKGFKNLSATVKVTINVNNKPDDPIIKDDGKAGYSVYEVTADNPMKNGTIVLDSKDGKEVCYEVTDEDEDQLETLVPYITDEGNTDADRIFDATIKKDGSKHLLCLVVKNTSKLNYETVAHEHKIKISVMDADKLTASVEKTITIVDVNEMPIISGNSTFSFYENKGEGYVVGKVYPDDIDTSAAFTKNVFTPIGGDTDLFTITEDGKIKAKRDFDYEEEKRRTFELEIALSDKDTKNYPKLTTSTKITISLKNAPEIPQITTTEFSVKENSDKDTFIGQLEAVDPDGDTELLFALAEENKYVKVSSDGKITVSGDAKIDYEKMQEFTISVSVKDPDGLIGISDVLIKVIDVNEPPTIIPQEFTFPEDSPVGTKKGPIDAIDPDKLTKKFSTLTFEAVDPDDKFEILPNGEIELKGELDYESQKAYIINVRVTDGEFSDTAAITINVGNVIEKSEVKITRVDDGEKVYIDPKDDIYTNKSEVTVEWKQDGKTKSSVETLHEGKNVIIKEYKDPTKDVKGADTVIVYFSTAAPLIDVTSTKTKVEAENIYTVVENVDKDDSTFYVNKKTKDVTVTVKDTVLDIEEKYDVTVVLDTIAVSSKTVKTLVDVSKSKVTLDKNPKGGTTESPVNGDKTVVSYEDKVNGTDITVSYNVNDKGEIIKEAVFDEKGNKSMVEVIEVSTVVKVGDNEVVVSYKADAETGKILYGDSEGNLLTSVPSSASVKDPTSSASKTDPDEVDLKTGVGAFTVTYETKGVKGNKSTVSYVIDEKGNIVENNEGDRGYLVTYTYTNKFGNSAEKSVFMVLDKQAPLVIINSPSDGDVVYANFVDVDWCIAIDGNKKNCVKQDTLNFQSLNKGVNTIKRIYRDKAGNETIAEIKVMMKKAKDVNIDLEKPMVIVSRDSVEKYYAENPPEKDQTFAVSILNPTTQTETEVAKGNSKKSKKGSGEEPYPGLDGHLGPTIKIDMKLPIVSAVGGLATLDDIVINGDMIALDGVDADSSAKMKVDDYVDSLCATEFQEEFAKVKDLSKMTLYTTKAHVTLWFYTTGGQFIDKYQFDYEVDDPEYVDKAGLVKFFFEMKLDELGELRDSHGRLYGTGPFIVKTKVDIRSKLRCTIPPIDGKTKFGDVLKSSDEMLKRFGYRRPVLRGNEKSSSKKSSSKSSSKSSKK